MPSFYSRDDTSYWMSRLTELAAAKGIRLEGVHSSPANNGTVLRFSDLMGVVSYQVILDDYDKFEKGRTHVDMIALRVDEAADIINEWLDDHAEGN